MTKEELTKCVKKTAGKNFDRRSFLRMTGASTLAMAISRLGFAEHREDASRPNIIFIMSDDHASHAMSCYGSKVNTTPNIDRIAEEGMRFINCFCTNSICAPSRAVILTGKYSHLNGVTDNTTTFDGNQQTFPKLLRKAGYLTAVIGKWHLKSEPTGFDYYNILPGQGVYHNPAMIKMGKQKKYQGYVTDIITDEALKWLEQRDRNKPFLLMCHHKAPHMPWSSDKKHAEMYDDTTFPLPSTFNDNHSSRTDAIGKAEISINNINRWMKWKIPEGLNKQKRKAWLYQQYMKVYLRSVASIDENVGRILDYLDSTGLARNTILIYTSDQGFFLGDHGLFDKRFIYEHSLRMPLLVRYPRHIEPDSVNTNIVLNLDFAPTFIDYAGIAIPEDMQGCSLRSLLKGKTPAGWRQSIYYHYFERAYSVAPHCGVRTKQYKLIHFYGLDAERKWELFDLQKDPDELKNLYGNPGFSKVVAELKKELTRLQKKFGDNINSFRTNEGAK